MNHDSRRLGIPSRFRLFGTRSNELEPRARSPDGAETGRGAGRGEGRGAGAETNRARIIPTPSPSSLLDAATASLPRLVVRSHATLIAKTGPGWTCTKPLRLPSRGDASYDRSLDISVL